MTRTEYLLSKGYTEAETGLFRSEADEHIASYRADGYSASVVVKLNKGNQVCSIWVKKRVPRKSSPKVKKVNIEETQAYQDMLKKVKRMSTKQLIKFLGHEGERQDLIKEAVLEKLSK